MADTLDVLTLAEAKIAINMAAAIVEHDTELAQQITAVSRVLDAEVGPVVQRTITDELQDGGGFEVNLRFWPATSITTVTEYSSGTAQVLTAETVSSLPANGYLAEPSTREPSLLSGRIIRRSSGSDYPFPTGRRNVKVTYVAGRYAATAAVDARFKSCAGAVLRRLWKRESGIWSQSSTFLDNIDPGDQTLSGFFRVAKPVIDEMLPGHVQVMSASGFA